MKNAPQGAFSLVSNGYPRSVTQPTAVQIRLGMPPKKSGSYDKNRGCLFFCHANLLLTTCVIVIWSAFSGIESALGMVSKLLA
jgi:hypothetical protein